MKALTLGATLLMATINFAQTKLIAFKSHSGSMNNFELALANPKMDLVNHNLGEAPEEIIRTTVLDSLIFVSDSQAVMITSNYCQNALWTAYYDSTIDVTTKTIWQAGTDTVLNHPLFSQQHSLTKIKSDLNKYYFFIEGEEKTVFVGYDDKLSEPMMDEDEDEILDNEKETFPITSTPSPKGGTGIILMSILLASILIGLVSWMVNRRTAKTTVSA